MTAVKKIKAPKKPKKETQALFVNIDLEVYLKLLNRCDITKGTIQQEVNLAFRKHLGLPIPTLGEN